MAESAFSRDLIRAGAVLEDGRKVGGVRREERRVSFSWKDDTSSGTAFDSGSGSLGFDWLPPFLFYLP